MWKLLICFFLLSSNLLGQDIADKLASYQSTHHLEKIYIAHDKPYYPIGDTIWCKAYYLDAQTHQTNEINPLVFVDWIDPAGKIISTLTLKIKEGHANFEIPLDQSLKAGKYAIRAYTQYQKNFDQAFVFQKHLTILDGKRSSTDSVETKPIEINFYPEGGELISGLTNRVAYEITGDAQLNNDQKLYLKDGDNKVIFETELTQGPIGVFDFIPRKGQRYFVELDQNGLEQKFELPNALHSGFVLKVNGADEDHIYISVSSNPKKLLSQSQLIGHVRGKVFVNQTIEKGGPTTFKLERNQIPSGILHFTLFSANQKPVCERLCFNYNVESKVDVNINLVNGEYKERSKVDLAVLTSKDSLITPSSLSLSVYNQDFFQSGSDKLNIVNYLLLQSDLKNPIPDINKHFSNNGVRNHYLLDLDLMTKTWRRFKWQDVIDEINPEIKYGTQENLQFLGIVKEKDKPVKANVNFFAAGTDFINSEIVTGEDGVFYFSGLDLRDSTMVFISASKYDEKNENKKSKRKPKIKNINIEYIPLDTLEVIMPSTVSRPVIYQKVNEQKVEYQANKITEVEPQNLLISELVRLDSLATAEWMIDIEEIVIKDSKEIKLDERRVQIQEIYKDRGWKYSNIANMLYLDDIPGALESHNVFNMISRVVPRVQMVTQANGDIGIKQGAKFSLSDVLIANQANLLPDGYIAPPGPTGNPVPPRPGTNLAFPILVDYQDQRFQAERVDPKKLFAMEIRYDERSGAIVYINLITRDPKDKYRGANYENTLNIEHPGYYKAREFYTPHYQDNKVANNKNSLRTTLYWNPDIIIKDKPEQLSFSIGDRKGNHVIVVEGISKSGIPFVQEKQFFVE